MCAAPLLSQRSHVFHTLVTTPVYRLVEDTFACLADDRLVFSDLRADKYRCLNPENTEAVLRLFPCFRRRDASGTPSGEARIAVPERTRLVMKALVHKGVLVQGRTGGKPVAPVCLPAPARDFRVDYSAPDPPFHLGHCVAFVQASLKASGKLRLQSLRRTAYGVGNRRRRCFDPSTQNQDAMLALVETFQSLRPFYPRAYICRFDSLALIEFLAHYRQFPRWVFGVRTEPFGAHCWVQENECILNDSLDFISQFTPIMEF